MTVEYYKTGGPAFPTTAENYSNYHPSGDGMTMRDYFAAKSLPMAMEEYRFVTSNQGQAMGVDWEAKYGLSSVARMAYDLADAMLEARQRAPT